MRGEDGETLASSEAARHSAAFENVALFFLTFFLYICSTDKQSSEVVFGGTDPNHYVGEITWIPLTSATYWQIKMDRYERSNPGRPDGKTPTTIK